VSIGEYYKRLDLPETASPDEIKRAYRRLRAKYHPDLNKGREASVEPVFKRIQEAFEVLTGTRAAAPGASTGAAAQGRGRPAGARQGHAAPAQSHPQNGAQKGSQAGAQAHSRDAYAGHSAWAAAGRWRTSDTADTAIPTRGANRHDKLYVPLEVALNGGTVPSSYQITVPCRQCGGASARWHAAPCDACGGQGRTADEAPCAACAGSGRASRIRCGACQGTGSESHWHTDNIAVPRGAWDGQQLTVTGGGLPGMHGGPSGDAILAVVILCGADFQRDGLHLSGTLQLDFVTATLGGPFATRMLDRELLIDVPPHCAQGSVIRLPGHGLSDASGNQGELRLQVTLAMPAYAAQLTAEERAQLRQIFADAARRGE
jgi:molecular chaperone DnaJ